MRDVAMSMCFMSKHSKHYTEYIFYSVSCVTRPGLSHPMVNFLQSLSKWWMMQIHFECFLRTRQLIVSASPHLSWATQFLNWTLGLLSIIEWEFWHLFVITLSLFLSMSWLDKRQLEDRELNICNVEHLLVNCPSQMWTWKHQNLWLFAVCNHLLCVSFRNHESFMLLYPMWGNFRFLDPPEISDELYCGPERLILGCPMSRVGSGGQWPRAPWVSISDIPVSVPPQLWNVKLLVKLWIMFRVVTTRFTQPWPSSH